MLLKMDMKINGNVVLRSINIIVPYVYEVRVVTGKLLEGMTGGAMRKAKDRMTGPKTAPPVT